MRQQFRASHDPGDTGRLNSVLINHVRLSPDWWKPGFTSASDHAAQSLLPMPDRAPQGRASRVRTERVERPICSAISRVRRPLPSWSTFRIVRSFGRPSAAEPVPCAAGGATEPRSPPKPARVTRCPGIPRSSFAPHFPTGANDSEASRKSSASEFTSDLGRSSNALGPDGAAEGLDLKTSEGYDWRVRTTAAPACATVTVAEPDTPPAAAVTTAIPLRRAVTRPTESTAATPG